jgi:hypothetical protein
MEQPPGFKDPSHPDWVCELDRSLYGLKQSPRQWNNELHRALLDFGLKNSAYNPTLYFKLVNGKLVGALTTHVDNLAIVGEPTFVDNLISSLGSKFKIGANEDLYHLLSLKISRDIPINLITLMKSVSSMVPIFRSPPQQTQISRTFATNKIATLLQVVHIIKSLALFSGFHNAHARTFPLLFTVSLSTYEILPMPIGLQPCASLIILSPLRI